MASESHYFVGLDLGQRRDYTALAVVERSLGRRYLNLRHLERMALGTPYPGVVARVRDIMMSAALLGRSTLALDATGLGAPVLDLLRRYLPGCPTVPVTITGARRESSSKEGHRVPKSRLILGLQQMLEAKLLRISAALAEGPALLAELRSMRVKMSRSGRETYAAWPASAHDDLALALALAAWCARPAGEVER